MKEAILLAAKALTGTAGDRHKPVRPQVWASAEIDIHELNEVLEWWCHTVKYPEQPSAPEHISDDSDD